MTDTIINNDLRRRFLQAAQEGGGDDLWHVFDTYYEVFRPDVALLRRWNLPPASRIMVNTKTWDVALVADPTAIALFHTLACKHDAELMVTAASVLLNDNPHATKDVVRAAQDKALVDNVRRVRSSYDPLA